MTLVDRHNEVLDFTLGYEMILFDIHNEVLIIWFDYGIVLRWSS